tara:strand:+ start:107 stop:223 length:117 start_codon:yes stop_codon:yes gene_type:complete
MQNIFDQFQKVRRKRQQESIIIVISKDIVTSRLEKLTN